MSWGRGSGLSNPPSRPPTQPTLAPAFPDVDECLEQTDECHYNQICENIPGGHRCSCPRGYRVQGSGLPCLGTGRATPSLGPWLAPPPHRQGAVITRMTLEFSE